MEYKVGDKVLVHGEITELGGSDHLPRIMFDGMWELYLHERVIAEPDKPALRFKVGDWVRKVGGECNVGKVGKIIEIYTDIMPSIPYNVEFSDDCLWVADENLEPAEEPKPPLKFKVGEHVIHKFAPHWGVGKITAISEGNTDIDLTQHYEGSMDDKANRPVAENTCQYRVVYPEVTGRGLDRRWWTSEANLIRVEVK